MIIYSNILVKSFLSFILFLRYLFFCDHYVEDKSSCDCGKDTSIKQESKNKSSLDIQNYRIVDGYEPDHRPWMAFIEICRHGTCGSRCGGSILNHRWIISAAHCFCQEWNGMGEPDCRRLKQKKGTKTLKVNYAYKGAKNGSITAFVGLADVSLRKVHKENQYKIKDIIIHPSYRPNDVRNKNKHQHGDLALLKTYDKIEFTAYHSDYLGTGISPICLPNVRQFSNNIFNKYPHVYVAGWGSQEDRECTTNKFGPSPFTKCKFPFEYRGEIYNWCIGGDTPAVDNEECMKLNRSEGIYLKTLEHLNYTKVHVENTDNRTIANCYPFRGKTKWTGAGWCGTCIPSAKKPGDRGYCRQTSHDPAELAKSPEVRKDIDYGHSIKEMKVLEDVNSPHWGMCDAKCDLIKYKDLIRLPSVLSEAELSIVNDIICEKLLKVSLRYHKDTELCAAKETTIGIRNYMKDGTFLMNNIELPYYRKMGDKYTKNYGGSDSCSGDSGSYC